MLNCIVFIILITHSNIMGIKWYLTDIQGDHFSLVHRIYTLSTYNIVQQLYVSFICAPVQHIMRVMYHVDLLLVPTERPVDGRNQSDWWR